MNPEAQDMISLWLYLYDYVTVKLNCIKPILEHFIHINKHLKIFVYLLTNVLVC